MVHKGEKDAAMRRNKKENKIMNAGYIILKIVMWVLIVFFVSDTIMQFISYSFYKGDRQLKEVACNPVKIQINDSLYGYGYNLDSEGNFVFWRVNVYCL